MLRLSSVSLSASRSRLPAARSLKKILARGADVSWRRMSSGTTAIYSFPRFSTPTMLRPFTPLVVAPHVSAHLHIHSPRNTKKYSTSKSPNSPLPNSNNKNSKWDIPTLYAKMVHFFKLGWQGVKQLYYNTKEANQISKRLKAGEPVSRREVRFLETNRKDLWRAGPFLLAWKIPLLGKLLTLFAVFKAPWLLPSTFNFLKPTVTWRQRLEQTHLYRRLVLSRLPPELELDDKEIASKIDYPMSTSEAATLVDTFKDDLKLQKLSNGQLSALCNALGLNGWGTNNMLIARIQKNLGKLLEDDARIRREGISVLTEDEVEEATAERGLSMQADLSPADLRAQLTEWLKLTEKSPELVLPLLIYHHAYHHSRQYKPTLFLSHTGYKVGQLSPDL